MSTTDSAAHGDFLTGGEGWVAMNRSSLRFLVIFLMVIRFKA